MLPIHFFTIVLNGEPFIRRHLSTFEKLPFRWHWHVIEGVADLRHDTAWSVEHGGRITSALHLNGLSNDGTTQYLDEIGQIFPDRVTLYRQPLGVFWDGKLEMVNAPLRNIQEECLLWQIDVDEIWTTEQIVKALQLFEGEPDRTAAWYFCNYFVGDELKIVTRDTYGNNTSYEWIRTWRYRPGDRWISHEPPRLCRLINNNWSDLAKLNPFMQKETENNGLVFDHFAYVHEQQLQFKEVYYGYNGAVESWKKLQQEVNFPLLLKNFFPWVHDESIVDKTSSGQQKPSIIWIRPDSIGDNILASAMIPHIREHLPHSRITVVCQAHIAELYEACPFIDGIITIPDEHAWITAEEFQLVMQLVQAVNPDILLNSTYSLHEISDVPGLEFIPKRVAFRQGLHINYTNILTAPEEYLPELDKHSEFLKELGINANKSLTPEIWVTPEDKRIVQDFLRDQSLERGKIIAVFPGARTHHKRYPVEKYASALNSLPEDYTFIVLGGNADIESCARLSKLLKNRTLDLAGKTTLRQMAVLISHCCLYVGADSSAAHIACAVGVLNVVLLGGGHYGRFFPYSPLTTVVSLPLECYRCDWNCPFDTVHCIQGIESSLVIKAIKTSLTGAIDKPRIFLQPSISWVTRDGIPHWQLPDLINDDRYSFHFFPETVDTEHISSDLTGRVSAKKDHHNRFMPRISIVTPSYNQVEFLEECIDSILSQNYPNLEYIIMDGGSTDGSVEIIKKYEKYLAHWQSQPDGGQYAAINAGFRRSTGDIMGWLNSDDKLHPGSFWLVSEIFKNPDIEWIMGTPTIWDQTGALHSVVYPAPHWSRENYLRGEIGPPHIQQESTFWRRKLWEKAGSKIDCTFKLAADMELWSRFFRHSQLYTVEAMLGGFRLQPSQKTAQHMDCYNNEAANVIEREQRIFLSAQDKTLLAAPPMIYLADVASQAGAHPTPDNFGFFTYSRTTHFPFFAGLDRELYGKPIDPKTCELKAYQDLLVLSFIRHNIPAGSRVLEIGGGDSRVLRVLNKTYECWNLDKLEGIGNGPVKVNSENFRLVRDYIGTFCCEIPSDYFDFVFSISVLEHIENREDTFRNILKDIDRVLKSGGLTLHCFDIVAGNNDVWTNPFLPFIFKHVSTLNRFVPLQQVFIDPQTYVMSQLAYESMWQSITNKSYHEFGYPMSYNVLWSKEKLLVNGHKMSKMPKEKQSDEVSKTKISPLFSIIIPTYNSASVIKNSVNSIVQQTLNDFEIIIVDNLSTDNTIEILKSYDDDRIKVFSQVDKGIYDAMNKGIKLASGKWLYFMGSDDTLFNNSVLDSISYFLKSNNFYYGNVKVNGDAGWAPDGAIYDGEFSLQKLLLKNICHQSIFYNKDVILKNCIEYKLKYPVCADWDFNLKCWSISPFTYVPITIATFNAGGLSTKKITDMFSDNLLYHLKDYFKIDSEIVLSKLLPKEKLHLLSNHNVNEVQSLVRLIAFHLPQFHTIPENDEWWGKGFTEWTNVTKAQPLFDGHYQPHVPSDLGYYDLSNPETLKAQAALASEYGIYGFCFYHYWFNGKLLLETPLHQMLASGKPDFPFCLCWANENWTRAWDGQNNQILIGQKYSDEDDIRHFEYLLTFLRDSRYIRVQGKPLLLIYRANQLPNPEKTGRTWRRLAREAGIGDLYLCKVENFHDEHYDPKLIGFDASIEFQPDWSMLGPGLTDPGYGNNRVYRYGDMVKIMLHKEQADYTRFPCVTPSWDNSARRKEQATIFIDANPAVYELWLSETISRMKPVASDENLIFINAWNEWGEGCHLEPDKRFGRAFLEATRSALEKGCCRVSIIVPVFNQVDFTRHCLETLYDNTPQELAYEVIVVDNASTDGTADFLADAAKRYPNLHIVRHQANLMFSGGCNSGARVARGRYLLFLNNDTEPQAGWLAPLLEMADNDEFAGVIGSKLLFMDGTVQHAGIVVGMFDGEPYPYHVHFGEPATLAVVNQVREFQMVTGACLLIRAGLFNQVGGFDKDFINGHEDLDLCMKARQAGFKVMYCPASVLIHFESRTKQLLGMENFHYQKGVNNEEGRGRRRFLDRWGPSLVIDDRKQPPEYLPVANLAGRADNKRKILFSMYGWRESGGGTIYPRSVAQNLVRRGYNVSVFYASLKNDPLMPPYSLKITNEDGVMLYGVYNRPALFTDPDHPEREIHDASVVQRFRQVLDEVSPDLVHFHNFHGLTFAIAEETHRRAIPCCYTPHNYHLIDPDLYLFNNDLSLWRGLDLLANSDTAAHHPEKRGRYEQRIAVTRQLLNEWVDVTLAVSSRQRELLIAHGGIPDRIAIVHQANASTDDLWKNELLQNKLHTSLHSPLQVGFIGGVMPQKGVHLLVAAAQCFKPEEAQFHIYGFASTPEYFDQLLRLDKNKVVAFHGPYSQSQLSDIAANLDIAVVPSVWEDCAPLVVLELHAMRLPVIGARIGGIPDFISEGIDGFLFDPFELASLVSLLRKCIANPATVMAMRNNLTEPVMTFERYVEHVEKIYGILMAGEESDSIRLSNIITPRIPVWLEGSTLSVSWQGGLFVHHSLALVSRELCLKLLDRGFDISFTSTEPDEFNVTPGDRLYPMEACRDKQLPTIDVTVRHQWPPDFSPVAAGKLVVIQPWEFGSAPFEWVLQINRNVDELWVPSNFVRDGYVESGVVADKVQVVPNGVATDCFHPAVPPGTLPTAKRFRFLFVGGTIHRKGIDILLAAYARAFTSNDDVCLVIKDMGGNSIYQGQTAQEMITAFTKVPGHPEILHLQEDFDNAQMASLYTACHCLVHPYRGEGFGLPIAEAMACGLAPIVTGYGAALDFCPPEIAWLIPAEKHLLPEKKIGNLATVDFPWLAEPDLAALAALMRHAFEHLDEVKQRGSAASCHIREHFTWDHAALVAEKRLRLLAQKAENGIANSKQSGNRMPQQEPVDIEAKESEVAMQNQLVQAACFKAEKLAQRGDVDAAVQVMLNEGIGGDADSPIPYLVLSGILMAAGRFEEVLGVAAEMPPATEKHLIHEIEAQCFCALGDDAAARKAAMLAGEQSPLALVVLGTLSARQGNAAYGEQLFRQAIALDSGCAKAWLSLAMILWSQGKLSDAWEAVKQAVSIDPLNAEAVRIMRDMASRMV